MVLDILKSLLRGLHNPLVSLIQRKMGQHRIPIQVPSYSSEYTEKLFSLLQVDPIQLQQLLLCKCANTTKYIPSSASVLAFLQIFVKGLVTHFTTPLNPNTYAKLDRSSGTR
jgi:hypothetical protein